MLLRNSLFSNGRQSTAKLLGWTAVQVFITHQCNVWPISKFSEPVIHRSNDLPNSQEGVAQHLARSLHLQFVRRICRWTSELNVMRHEGVSRLPDEQDDLRPP